MRIKVVDFCIFKSAKVAAGLEIHYEISIAGEVNPSDFVTRFGGSFDNQSVIVRTLK